VVTNITKQTPILIYIMGPCVVGPSACSRFLKIQLSTMPLQGFKKHN
jgi:hypothetical protein